MKGIISFFKRLFGKKSQVAVKAEVKIETIKEVAKTIEKAEPVKSEPVKEVKVKPVTAKEIKDKVKKPAEKNTSTPKKKPTTKKPVVKKGAGNGEEKPKAAPRKRTPKKKD